MDRFFTRKRLSEMVADEIRSMIRQEGLQPGDRVFSEHELTRRLNVSRSSVREAIRILEVTGLLTVQQGRGVFLRDTASQQFEPLGAWIREHADALFEQFEVRRLLEPECAARAAELAERNELLQMRESLQLFEEHCASEAIQGAIAQDEIFHTLIARATRNRTMHILMKTFARNLTEGWITSMSIRSRRIKTIAEHRAILDAIADREPDAARAAMLRHLDNALADIKEQAVQNGA